MPLKILRPRQCLVYLMVYPTLFLLLTPSPSPIPNLDKTEFLPKVILIRKYEISHQCKSTIEI